MKKFLIIFFSFFVFLVFPKEIIAENEFISDIEVEYNVLETGITKVTHKISLENVFTNLYATSYNLSLENINPQNVKVIYNDSILEPVVKTRDKITDININFEDAIVGKGKKRVFEIIYENSSFAQRTGEVWEISIPKLSSEANFRTYDFVLSVPRSLGLEAYISPKPISSIQKEDSYFYRFNKNLVSQTGITAGFGAFQVFSFTLNYHLENPIAKISYVEIAIPPDTGLQKVYYSSINPQPEEINIDFDGNWLAGFNLKPRERLDIQVDGSVQIFAGARPFLTPSDENLVKYLDFTEYWNSDNQKIKEIAFNYKTPKDIYDFVVNTLSYSYERVSPESKRMGAIKALNDPNKATCMEFTDLFIAITRAAGIPSREINGFAYTENPKIQPLSLVNDVLHSWPEYWDFENSLWRQVDPTWASTTGGIDYFNKLDLRHFTFVIHGIDSTKPYTPGSYKLGPNPQKDVFVNFGSLPEKRNSSVKLSKNVARNIPFAPTLYEIEIYNEGPVALYNLKPSIIFDNVINEEKYIEVLPPYSKSYIKVSIPYSLLGRNTPSKAEVVVIDSLIDLKTYKNKAITDSLFLLFLLSILFVVILIIRLKPKIILNIWYKISSRFKKNDKNDFKDQKNKDIQGKF
ncbi:transglutaminase family protein [Patescibacteria group bacterium]